MLNQMNIVLLKSNIRLTIHMRYIVYRITVISELRRWVTLGRGPEIGTVLEMTDRQAYDMHTGKRHRQFNLLDKPSQQEYF